MKKATLAIFLVFIVIIFFQIKKKEVPTKSLLREKQEVSTKNLPRKGVQKLSDTKKAAIVDTALYMSIGNPDTALVLFFYKNSNNYSYDDQREEYIRWDLEYNNVKPLFDALFKEKSNYWVVVNQINKNRIKFLIDGRNEVLKDYISFNSIINSMIFHFLLEKRDPFLKQILEKMKNNKKVRFAEKDSVKVILKNW